MIMNLEGREELLWQVLFRVESQVPCICAFFLALYVHIECLFMGSEVGGMSKLFGAFWKLAELKLVSSVYS